MLFSKKKNQFETAQIKPTSMLLSRIRQRSAKEYAISEYETEFFISFEKQLNAANLNVDYFWAERMGSGSIRVDCPAGIIGTVHLRKKIGSIQYFLSTYDHHNMTEAPYEAVIAVIPYWISYAKKCIRSREKALSI